MGSWTRSLQCETQRTWFRSAGATVALSSNVSGVRPSNDSAREFAIRDPQPRPSNETFGAHESRLARDFGTKRFGSEGYAIEELVAELGAAFLCADLDLTLEPREDHAAYIANWLDVLKADNRAIFAAASGAQRAADFINGLQPVAGCKFAPGRPGMDWVDTLPKWQDTPVACLPEETN